MDSNDAKRVLRGEWEGDRAAARDILLCDIHEWLEVATGYSMVTERDVQANGVATYYNDDGTVSSVVAMG